MAVDARPAGLFGRKEGVEKVYCGGCVI